LIKQGKDTDEAEGRCKRSRVTLPDLRPALSKQSCTSFSTCTLHFVFLHEVAVDILNRSTPPEPSLNPAAMRRKITLVTTSRQKHTVQLVKPEVERLESQGGSSGEGALLRCCLFQSIYPPSSLPSSLSEEGEGKGKICFGDKKAGEKGVCGRVLVEVEAFWRGNGKEQS
jgi:hypothetical protein